MKHDPNKAFKYKHRKRIAPAAVSGKFANTKYDISIHFKKPKSVTLTCPSEGCTVIMQINFPAGGMFKPSMAVCADCGHKGMDYFIKDV